MGSDALSIMNKMSSSLARGLCEAPLRSLLVVCFASVGYGSNPASYPGSVDNGNGTFTYVFRPSGGANDGSDQGGSASGKDTFILNNETAATGTTNYGAADYTHHFNSNCNAWWGWSFFQWDVAALPPAADVSKVTLVLYQRIIRGYAGWGYQSPVTEMVLQAPVSAWNEMTLTYNTRPALNPLVLARVLLATNVLIPNVVPPSAECWFDGLVRIDITDLYKQWSGGTRPNYGVAYLRPQAWCENANSNLVYTSDHVEVAKRPALEIVYQGAVTDKTPPVIAAPAAITAEASSSLGAAVGFTASAFDNKDGPVSVVAVPPSGSTFRLGKSTVTLTATDAAGNTASQNIDINVVDTTPPALTLPQNQTLDATSASGAVATFTATASDAVGVSTLTVVPASGSTFPIGTTTVNVTASDAAGHTSTGAFTVTVRNVPAPVITSLSANPAMLYPPNHKMVNVALSAVVTGAATPTTKIVSVTSNEAVKTKDDDDLAPDWIVTGNLALQLRAERLGTGSGRVYTITVESRVGTGPASTKTVTVTVPKSQGEKDDDRKSGDNDDKKGSENGGANSEGGGDRKGSDDKGKDR